MSVLDLREGLALIERERIAPMVHYLKQKIALWPENVDGTNFNSGGFNKNEINEKKNHGLLCSLYFSEVIRR